MPETPHLLRMASPFYAQKMLRSVTVYGDVSEYGAPMGIMKMLARRGAVGSTARWAAKGYFAFQKVRPDGDLKELFNFLSNGRYSGRGLREEQALNELIERGEIPGLAHFVTVILMMEAGFSENTPSNRSLFRDVIMEELNAANIPSSVIHTVRY